MNELFKSFDTYSLKARVLPALIAGLPTLAFLFVIVRWDDFSLSQVTATAMGFVLLCAFADVARRQGKRIERKLGTGATPELWHRRDTTLASGTNDRCRAYVARQINLTEPTGDEEECSPQAANEFYIAAGNWIREQTRDQQRFAVLFSENISGGRSLAYLQHVRHRPTPLPAGVRCLSGWPLRSSVLTALTGRI